MLSAVILNVALLSSVILRVIIECHYAERRVSIIFVATLSTECFAADHFYFLNKKNLFSDLKFEIKLRISKLCH